MSRLKSGAQAPQFQVQDIFGNAVDLAALKGKKVMLSFYRYAGCPLCNLRVHSLLEETKALEDKIVMIAVFQSSSDAMLKFVGRQQAKFPFIADPDMKLYRQYGVETSWMGLLKILAAIHKPIIAMSKGFLPGWIDGPINRLPADFLIDENGVVQTAFYGNNIGDHIPIPDIHAFAS